MSDIDEVRVFLERRGALSALEAYGRVVDRLDEVEEELHEARRALQHCMGERHNLARALSEGSSEGKEGS